MRTGARGEWFDLRARGLLLKKMAGAGLKFGGFYKGRVNLDFCAWGKIKF